MKSSFSLSVLFLASFCSAAFEGVKPASSCWNPSFKKDLSLAEFIPDSVNTALSGGSSYEGANGKAGNIGNSVIKSKLSFISDTKELAQAFTCIVGLLDQLSGRKEGSFEIKVKNETPFEMSFYGVNGKTTLYANRYGKYQVFNKYGVFFFKWNNACYGTRFKKGSSVYFADNIYIGENKITVYQKGNRRWDAGCKWFAVYDNYCDGPYDNDKELKFIKEYINHGYTERCDSRGVN